MPFAKELDKVSPLGSVRKRMNAKSARGGRFNEGDVRAKEAEESFFITILSADTELGSQASYRDCFGCGSYDMPRRVL